MLKKISPLARKVFEVPTSLEINFCTIEISLHCSFQPEKTSLYHSLLGEISYSTENRWDTLSCRAMFGFNSSFLIVLFTILHF